MTNTGIGTVTAKGQVSIPAKFRTKLNIEKGDKLTFTLNDNQELIVSKEPSKLDWDDLFASYPTEVVDIDENGKYDEKKSPNFHDWMVNG
ncbi:MULTISPECIES: AbrB/MazE/SpoVT family DNA-binding domain-containing protein [Leuconostoc]|jgi:AbrB family looped-hinge helix DNA binding protein|uniref:AbrB/MazE/SpoVT family DNA-binding domain-containing protein n=1 Tax=Leuconostoc pseudomesenteroides TaxID=33968 RepID=A0ABT6HEL3_LEUPS|nr:MULTISPECIES: AbrB/MazE/SpoVT family DNA-binding domain-containing protein [Leuconostoc]MBK0040712.1 AbrB/MazE/SpoVT family DNA-binding domain-containing protein [Leuconostoc sp. S51]MBK0051758.1 AbrB/MazE/SpoVT family DNA-binding domain-containing protein [Leuconostoc sp. S50]MBS0958170.1 AbrB/MazE/SpoVT family DNA-binding domain-containing protein [Leuconostoc pseudomesenteroides]MCT4380218.1 AbrB/MazE/SpoVT family DNA-binding domain-containing protein [Leuconostoc pseudomesenteroides]MDG